jgi:hypothetical protein
MALVRLNGDLSYNDLMLSLGTSFTSSTPLTTANTTKLHMLGRFWHKDRITKTISSIYARLGTVTANAASVLQLSIQNPDLVNGPPGRGDGTILQSGTTLGSNLTSNSTVYVPLAAGLSMAMGASLVVVAQLTTFNTGDSVTFSSVSNLSAFESFLTFESATPTFTVSNTSPMLFFVCSDGTVGTFNKTCPVSTTSTVVININSATDEIAMEFSMPIACTLSGVRVTVGGATGSDFDVVLYSGTTVLATATPTLDQNTTNIAGSNRIYNVQFPETNLTANTIYAISILPTTVNNVTVYYADVSATAFWYAHQAEIGWGYKTRANAGAWSALNSSRRPFMALMFSKVDDGAGGGGGTPGISRSRTQSGM